MKIFEKIIFICSLTFLCSCDPDLITKSEYRGEKYSGYVTYYSDYSNPSFAVPEIADGYFTAAISEQKLKDFPIGTALKITWNGRSINVIINDLCPDSSNSHHTYNPNYYLDLAENGARALFTDLTPGMFDVEIEKIPYGTKQNLKMKIKENNGWYFSFWLYNMRYPLSKIEYAFDSNNFTEVSRDPSSNICGFYFIQCNEGLNSHSTLKIRATDILGHTVNGSFAVNTAITNSIIDLKANFENDL